jgi:phage shock protein A
MKSKRAEEFIRNSAFSAIQLPGEVMYSMHMNVDGKLLKRKNAEVAVDLAEQDAEEEVTRYRTELEESKKREELARKVIDDQRKEMEKLKARAVEAFKEYMKQAHGGYLSSDLDDFIQKLNER